MLLAAAVLWIAAAPPALSASFERVGGFDEMVLTSSLAFRGEVVSVTSHETRLGSGVMPFTEVVLRVDDGLVGARAGELRTVRVLGGEATRADGRRVVMHVPGAPTWKVGAEYLVFANDRLEMLLGTRWGARGALRLDADAEGSRTVSVCEDASRCRRERVTDALDRARRVLAEHGAVSGSAQTVSRTRAGYAAELRRRLPAGAGR